MAESNPPLASTQDGLVPSREVIPPRRRAKKQKSEAEKREEKEKRRQEQEKEQHLADKIEAYFLTEDRAVEEIAERTGYSVERVRRALKTSAMKRLETRDPNPHNAMVSFKIRELNKDIPDGEEKVNVKTFAEMVKQDPALKEMTEDEKKEAMDWLLEKRRIQKVGVRGSTRGATVEGLAAMGRIADAIHTVNSHGSLVGFACMTKSSVNSSFTASWAGTEGVPEFFLETFNVPMDKLILMYELWECNRSSQPRTKNLPSLQKHCTKVINDNLQFLLQKQGIAMKYKQYEKHICLEYHVQLRGWPEGVKFDSPYQMGRIADLEKLRDALRTGECKWVKLKPNEYKELQERVAARDPPARKTRADKGQKRKRDSGGNSGREPRAKKRADTGKAKSAATLKTTVERQLPASLKNKQRAVKSSEFVESSDSGEGEGEERESVGQRGSVDDESDDKDDD
ncbi:hypothetical protein NMY22_g20009 [Coprinellus aureogranulatus]|nr:hypothetical protein NMY22_g20009 [Coprinellus aureogranulatus]